MRSYVERKNPWAVIDAFKNAKEKNSRIKSKLVLKVHGQGNNQLLSKLKARLDQFVDDIIVIDHLLDDNEVKNLIRCSDCFISLHRSEGYGRGMAEAMALAKPVIATAYSGNLDFMNENNSLLVDYKLIPVKQGEYPHGNGQVWADPDIGMASSLMEKLMNDPEIGRKIGKRARVDILKDFSYLATGIRMIDRISEIRRSLESEGVGHDKVIVE